MPKDQGGNAFSRPDIHIREEGRDFYERGQEGMTMRQWYKGQALLGMMSRDTFDEGQATPEQRAKLAGIEADAMIAEDRKAEK